MHVFNCALNVKRALLYINRLGIDSHPNSSNMRLDGVGYSACKKKVCVYLDTKYTSSDRKAINRNWSIQKANPALKTKAGNK